MQCKSYCASLTWVTSTCCARCRCPILLQTLEVWCQKHHWIMRGGVWEQITHKFDRIKKPGLMTGTEELREWKKSITRFLKRFFPLFIREGQVCVRPDECASAWNVDVCQNTACRDLARTAHCGLRRRSLLPRIATLDGRKVLPDQHHPPKMDAPYSQKREEKLLTINY